jgi:hypothetical protein
MGAHRHKTVRNALKSPRNRPSPHGQNRAQRMRALKISKWHPNPLAEIERREAEAKAAANPAEPVA